MVGALDLGSNGLGSRPGQGTALYSLARHFTLTVRSPPRCTHEYQRNNAGHRAPPHVAL